MSVPAHIYERILHESAVKPEAVGHTLHGACVGAWCSYCTPIVAGVAAWCSYCTPSVAGVATWCSYCIHSVAGVAA